MTDYLGPLSIGSSGTYVLTKWDSGSTGTPTISVEVIVRSTTADLLAAALEALVAQLYIGNTWVHYQPGVTNPVAYSVAGITDFKQDALVSWPVFWQRVSFTIAGSPRPAGALTTLLTAHHVDTPASEPLEALLGTHQTSLDVTIDDDNSTNMHSVWCALAPTVLTDTKWYVLASALTGGTWSSMSSGTGSTYWGNSNRYTTSATALTGLWDTSAYPTGKYRLLARVRQEAGTGYIKDSQNDTFVAIRKTTPHLVVLGDIDLPIADTASGTAANLTISIKSDGTNDCMVNALVFLPLEYGFFSWHHDTDTSEINQLDVGPTGVFMWATGSADGITDMTYFSGGVLTPRVLACHVGTLVTTPSPSGTSWPADWGRTDGTDVTAASSKFHVVLVTESKWAWYAATNVATPIVVPGAWYELSLLRQVTARSAGAAEVRLVWQDVDGNTVRDDLLATTSTTDASPVTLTLYAKAPAHAARAQVKVGGGTGATITADFSAVVLRRCPLRLIVVAEDAAGALTSYYHPVHLTVKYTPRYEIAR